MTCVTVMLVFRLKATVNSFAAHKKEEHDTLSRVHYDVWSHRAICIKLHFSRAKHQMSCQSSCGPIAAYSLPNCRFRILLTCLHHIWRQAILLLQQTVCVPVPLMSSFTIGKDSVLRAAKGNGSRFVDYRPTEGRRSEIM
jgi:hypothetical protein